VEERKVGGRRAVEEGLVRRLTGVGLAR
jgi:hypothetical protein